MTGSRVPLCLGFYGIAPLLNCWKADLALLFQDGPLPREEMQAASGLHIQVPTSPYVPRGFRFTIRTFGRTGDKMSCLRRLPCDFIPRLRVPGCEVWDPAFVGVPIEVWDIADVVSCMCVMSVATDSLFESFAWSAVG